MEVEDLEEEVMVEEETEVVDLGVEEMVEVD